MGWLDQASKGAAEQWGRRHERAMMRLHVVRLSAVWFGIAVFLAFVFAPRVHVPNVFAIVRHHVMVFGITGFAITTLAIIVIIAARRGTYHMPRAPRGYR